MHRYIFIFLLITFFLSCNESEETYQPVIVNNNLIQDTLLKANKFLLERDREQIESYIKRRSWNMNVTQSGLWYEIYEKTNGKKVQSGDIIKYNYQIELMDGTVCYSSDSTGTNQIKIGQSGKEIGLEEGLKMMRTGEKARFIMPPYMAHGLIGDMERIPYRSVIVYTAEIIEIIDF